MHNLDLDSVYYSKTLCHALSEVHGAVLASGAAEGDLKIVAAIALVLLDGLADRRLCRPKERLDRLRESGEKVHHRLITSRVAAQGFIPERIRHRSAVKDKATAVPGRIFRNSAFEGE